MKFWNQNTDNTLYRVRCRLFLFLSRLLFAQVKRATKAYRVYFSEGPDREEGANEYIVDHSIVTYLVDPKGVFSANFGQRTSPEEISGKIVEKINEFYMDQ